MDGIPEIVVFSVYRVSSTLDLLNSTKENVSHPILWQYDSFPATAILGTYMAITTHKKKLCLWLAQLLYVEFAHAVFF